MRRIVLTGVCALAALLVGGMSGGACGDKLLALGRGVRFQLDSAPRPASILLYIHPGSPASPAISDPQFQSALKKAGHKIHVASSEEELAEALKAGQYDIVFADLGDARSLEQQVQSTSSNPVVLPVIYQATKAETQAAEKEFGCFLKTPGRTGHYLAVVDKVMQLKSKPNGPKATAKK